MSGDPAAHARSIWPAVAVGSEIARARSEWLHTNGAGAYASSTVACLNTRRYHGLLVAALDPPRSRHVILSHIDVTVRLADKQADAPPSPRSFELFKHQFPGTDPDRGAFYLDRYDQDPLPRWTYKLGGGELEQTVALVRGENAAVLRYTWRGDRAAIVTLRPLLAMRHFHQLQQENGGMAQRVELRGREVRVQPRRDLPRVCFRYEGTFVGSPDWWRRFEYLAERDRGLEFHEDLWTPGVFELRFEPTGEAAHLVVAVDKLPEGEPPALLAGTREAILAEDPGPEKDPLERRLTIAAETFRADLAARPGILAGYPWFEVWGRDSLIALPGLYLVPKKLDGAMRILRTMIASMQDGLIPNRLPDQGETAEFHTADATLWLFEAARLVADQLGETHPFVTDELLLALRDAFEAAARGTRNNIHVTAEGLFAAGHPGDSLTWMDARVNGKAVTPRVGCPVELQALWAKGCETLGRLARAAGDHALCDRATAAARQARKAFSERFWCDETSYPYDVVSESAEGEGAFRDPAIRPNAVIALAVDPDSFSAERAALLLDRARLELVTRAGLRTLAPGEAAYLSAYRGGVATRDGAYHQGTVWPWLLGFYVRAARRSGVEGEHLTPLLRRLIASAAANELALGHVPEIADADPPHKPNGCFAQAWSVSELLRALAWDLRWS
jgi:predicted glycogen debranching enzyme